MKVIDSQIIIDKKIIYFIINLSHKELSMIYVIFHNICDNIQASSLYAANQFRTLNNERY